MKTLSIRINLILIFASFMLFNLSCDKEDLEVVLKPDLQFVSGDIICPPHSNYQIGWEANVKNIGAVSAEATVQAWLSHDETLGDDAAAGGKVFGTIDANGNIESTFGATVSNVGDYKYLLLQIDHNELVDESDETNNLIVIKIPENYPYAMCKPENFDAITCGDIHYNESNLSKAKIAASDETGNLFKPGDVIIYITNENRCGKLQILNIDDAVNKKLTIKAVTFNSDGSIYKETNALEIRGTWTCDLDEMVEAERGVDFWWERVILDVTYFNPQNNARFYKYEL